MRISDWSSDVCSSDLYRPDLPDALTQDNVGALRPPPPQAFPGMEDQLPIPDRWRLIETLGVVKERWFDPYNQNTYKGDRPIDRSKVKWLPIKGDDWFIVANADRKSTHLNSSH